MGQRRMFSKRIISSARFLKMPISCQALYYHLGMYADDDGVVEAYTVIKNVGCSEDDLKVLVAKGFVQVLNDDLVSYITDWTENNTIRADRKIDSIYKDLLVSMRPDVKLVEKKQRSDVKKPPILGKVLEIEQKDGQSMDSPWTDNGQPMDSPRTDNGQPMDGVSKDNISKVNKEKENKVRERESNNVTVLLPKSDLGKPKSVDASINDLLNETAKAVIDYLNIKAGTRFRYCDRSKRFIKTRMSDGFTLADFKAVIDKKVKDWNGTKMQEYLRPETLFGAKFESYLNGKEKGQDKPDYSKNEFNQMMHQEYDYDEIEKRLLSQ